MKQSLYERLIQYILDDQDRFYRVAYSYTRHQEDALDAVQSAVCKALEAHERIKNADAIRTWFYKILINECLTVLKKRGRVVLTADTAKQEEAYYEKGYEQGGDIEQELEKLENQLDSPVRESLLSKTRMKLSVAELKRKQLEAEMSNTKVPPGEKDSARMECGIAYAGTEIRFGEEMVRLRHDSRQCIAKMIHGEIVVM